MNVVHLARAIQRTAQEVLTDAHSSVMEPRMGGVSYGTDIGTDTVEIQIKAFDHMGEHKYRILVIEEERTL